MSEQSRNWIRSLAGIAVAAALPIIVFAVVVATAVLIGRRTEVEHRYAAIGRALLAAVDVAVLGQQAAVAGLAHSIAPVLGDPDRLHAMAAVVAAGRRGAWQAALLTRPDGTGGVPIFEAVPGVADALGDVSAIRAAAAADNAVAGSIEPPRPGGPAPFLPTRAPVVDAGGQVIGVLSVASGLTRFDEIVAAQQAPAAVLISVYDRDRRVVSRSAQAEIFVGKDASPSVKEQLERGQPGLFLNITLTGERYYRVSEISPITGWSVAVGASEQAFLAEITDALKKLTAAGLAAILAGALAASLLARRFGRRLVAEERCSAARIKESEQRYRAISAASGQIHWSTTADGATDEDSLSWRTYTGQTAEELMAPGGWTVPLHADDRGRVVEEWRTAVAERRPFEAEYRMRHHSGSYRWMLARGTPLIGDDGGVRGWIGMTIDIDQRKRAEERQSLLMREIDHRAKNVLTVVLAMVQMTRADTVEAYAASVNGRIAALARAHTLLADSHWTGCRLQDLLDSELAPFRSDAATITVGGGDVIVAAEVVQPLAMMFHELATNAAKHGSLSKAGGRVAIDWTVDPATGWLTLTWTERGGPPVSPPRRVGFGSRLLKEVAARQLEANVGLDWHPLGLCCTLVLPSHCLRQGDTAQPAAVARPPAASPRWASTAAPKVLVVEDEGLIALDLQRMLEDHGYQVVGPAATIGEAAKLLTMHRIDAALLDVNIGGTPILTIAEELVLDGTPVVFYTGYGKAGDLGGRFPNAQVLTKPASEAEIAQAIEGALARRHAALN